MRKLNFAGTIVSGGLLGGLLVSVITHLIYTAKYPHVVEDGQYGMIFMGTVPLGWLIGAIAGAVAAWHTAARPRRPWLVAGLLVAGGVVAGPIMGIYGVFAVGLVWLLLHPYG